MAMTSFALSTLKLEVAPRKIIHLIYKEAEFVFKTMTKKEYDEVLTLSCGDKEEMEVLICEFCYLFPKDYDFRNGIAGLPTHASKVILDSSLVIDIDKIKSELDIQREKVKNIENQFFIAIKSAMPNITKDMFDNMSWQEITNLVALSEQILRVQNAALVSAFRGEVFDYSIRWDENTEPISEDEVKQNEEIAIQKIREKGLDPALVYGIPTVNKVDDIVPTLFLGGRYWDRSDVLDVIRNEKR